MPKNIEMSVLNSEGSYDVLYPMTIAENVLNLGSFVSENDLILSSTTKDLLGISQDSTPDDAFAKLALGTGKFGYRFHITTPLGNPVIGAKISNIQTIMGEEVITDKSGIGFGVSESTNFSTTVTSPCLDLNDVSTQVVSDNVITDIYLTCATKEAYNKQTGEDTFETSQNIRYSLDIESFDLCLVGGGGTAGEPQSMLDMTAGGGCGGDTTNVLNLDNTGDILNIVVGSGGGKYYYDNSNGCADINLPDSGSPGGNTTITYGENNYEALGGGTVYIDWTGTRKLVISREGNGGVGGYPYSSGTYSETALTATAGSNATVYKFNDSSLGFAGGGGGGGSPQFKQNYQDPVTTLNGGLPYGGKGANIINQESELSYIQSAQATNYGGGGGGFAISNCQRYQKGYLCTGCGYQGVVFIRWHKQTS